VKINFFLLSKEKPSVEMALKDRMLFRLAPVTVMMISMISAVASTHGNADGKSGNYKYQKSFFHCKCFLSLI
jgi:hypothetical protein